MATHARDIDQHYWRDPRAAHVEIRNTRNSTLGYKAHSHVELSLGIIESGQTRLTNRLSNGDTDIILSSGEMILIPPHLVHACNPIGDTSRSYHMIYVDPDWCQETLSHIYDQNIQSLPIEPVVIQNPELSACYFGIAKTLHTGLIDLARLDSFLFQILGSYCDTGLCHGLHSNQAQQAKRTLLQHLAEPLSLDDLASQLSITTETLIRNFKKAYGITPKAFLHNARIEKAKVLLRAGMPIVEAALEVGYADQSQFHKAFVAFCAATPKQYQTTKAHTCS